VTNEHKRLVEEGYDRMAEQYLASKDARDPVTFTALEELARVLQPGATVLDLGCGAGIPATLWLTDHRFAVTGVDISARQIELARRLVPAANFIKADMTSLNFTPETFDAVVSLYAITHVPRTEQPELVSSVRRWLRPDGAFLATWSMGAWEGEEEDWESWGAPMWWSNRSRDANLKMLRDAGFAVESAEVRGDESESWLWVLARKGG
jgi:cyclopropane fatty-acyl-phospholipid synthase-like methyltransferase